MKKKLYLNSKKTKTKRKYYILIQFMRKLFIRCFQVKFFFGKIFIFFLIGIKIIENHLMNT